MIAPRIAVVQGSLTDGQGTLLANASSARIANESGMKASRSQAAE